MIWFCWHKWGEIKNGYQYCKKCGIAIPVPCSHVWETINTLVTSTQYIDLNKTVNTGELYVLKCKKCGEIKEKRIGTYG